MAIYATKPIQVVPAEQACGYDIARFLRAELPRDEVRALVRHLLKGCPACLRVSRRLWSLGEGPTVAAVEEDVDRGLPKSWKALEGGG